MRLLISDVPITYAHQMAPEPPQPTAPPDLQVLALRLQERQLTATTCGWVNGNLGTYLRNFPAKYALLHELTRLENKASPVTCENGYLCCSNTVQRAHGCCIFLPASFPTACIDSTAAISNCDNSCIEDFSTIKWYDKTNATPSLDAIWSEQFADLKSTVSVY